MIIGKHNHLGSRFARFIVLMLVLISFSLMSSHHVEMRFNAKDSSDTVMDYKYKSFVKPRHSAAIQRMNWTPELISVVIFLLQLVAVTLLTTPIYKRFSSISLLMKRLFLMPIKFTSTSI